MLFKFSPKMQLSCLIVLTIAASGCGDNNAPATAPNFSAPAGQEATESTDTPKVCSEPPKTCSDGTPPMIDPATCAQTCADE